jgi:hypothetical protein
MQMGPETNLFTTLEIPTIGFAIIPAHWISRPCVVSSQNLVSAVSHRSHQRSSTIEAVNSANGVRLGYVGRRSGSWR